jgi:hypothetical protein
MTTKILRQLAGLAAIALLALGCFSIAAAQHIEFVYQKIVWEYQTVKVTRENGSVFDAEFLGEIVVLPNGRANGGFGIWELNGPNVLSLYHVVEGTKDGANFTFKARPLSPLPNTQGLLTVRMQARRDAPPPGLAPAGSVVFIDNTIGQSQGRLEFTANGEVQERCIGGRGCDQALPEFGFIQADPQTVVVQSLAGTYTASFEHVTLVLSQDRAIGALSMSDANGDVQKVRIVSGNINFRDRESQTTWLRGRATNSPSAQPSPVLMVIANRDFFETEPCRIYDIVGTQSASSSEITGRITALVSDPF